MPPRPWIALLLLINYLIVVGAGCINQPEDQHELVMVQTSEEGHHYQQCRYLRMDGLENFLIEALASRYRDAPRTPPHHQLIVVNGIDAHHLPLLTWPLYPSAYRLKSPKVAYKSSITVGVFSVLYAPPWLG